MERKKYQKNQCSWWKVLDKEYDDEEVCQSCLFGQEKTKIVKEKQKPVSSCTKSGPVFIVFSRKTPQNLEKKYYSKEKCNFIRNAIEEIEKIIKNQHEGQCSFRYCECPTTFHKYTPEIRLKKIKNSDHSKRILIFNKPK